jgi:dihydrofolate synthase / folylpolyglutamate synthase
LTKNKFSDYNKCISYLFNLERSGIKYDLKNIKTLLDLLNNPQNNFKSIHVAGTNGKGSVSSIINSMLIESGCSTGLYTSPHIRDFRERILVNGKFISRKFILNFVNRLFQDIEKINPSFFEITTAMAFEYFSSRKINYAVVETGLGGRLDSTNVIEPVVSVISTLSIDHIKFLGKSIEEITREKGGIIKNSVPLVVGNVPEVSAMILKKIAKKKKSKIIFADENNIEIIRKTESGFYFDFKKKFKRLFYPMVGDYQVSNLKTSLAAIEIISAKENIDFNYEITGRAFKNLKFNSKFYGRFELISMNPKIVIDVSHNEQAIKNIESNLRYFKYDKLLIIFGMMKDKDYKSSLRELQKLDAEIILTKPDFKRAAEPIELFNAVNGNKRKFILKDNLKNAFMYAEENSNPKDLILITGSFFLVSEFLALFNKYNKST